MLTIESETKSNAECPEVVGVGVRGMKRKIWLRSRIGGEACDVWLLKIFCPDLNILFPWKQRLCFT